MGKGITTTEVTDNLLLLRPQTQRQTCVWKRAFSVLIAVSHAGRQLEQAIVTAVLLVAVLAAVGDKGLRGLD